MLKAKVTTVGSSTGIILPKEILAKLNLKKGDSVTFVETPNGIELTAYDPNFEEELELARSVMRDYRNALRKLAQ